MTINKSISPEKSYKNRQSSVTFLLVIGLLILIIGFYVSWLGKSDIGYVFTAILGLSSMWLGVWQNKRIQKIRDELVIQYTELQKFDKWQQINGPINQLLTTPVLSAASTNLDSQVTAYSFDRLVVCDRDEIAQFLINNNFHFEYNCAILTINGYPQNIFATVLGMLKQNPDLVIYAFHDASPTGVELSYKLSSDVNWFKNSNSVIIDLGLHPKQVLNNRGHLFTRYSQNSAQVAKNLPPEVRQSLTQTELAWLDEGNYVELESFSPRRLIQILKHGITTGSSLDINNGDDSSTIIYGVENFG